MQKDAARAARLLRAAAVGVIALGLPVGTAACASSSSSSSVAAATTAAPDDAVIGTGCSALSASAVRALKASKGLSGVLANPMFTTLSKDVRKSGVGSLWRSKQELTVIAPVDDAFASMRAADAAAMKNNGQLAKLLRGHAADTRITPKMFNANSSVKSLAGTALHLTQKGDSYLINGVTVVCGNIQAGQITVYVVGQVLSH